MICCFFLIRIKWTQSSLLLVLSHPRLLALHVGGVSLKKQNHKIRCPFLIALLSPNNEAVIGSGHRVLATISLLMQNI
jgi:hypothetical protein